MSRYIVNELKTGEMKKVLLVDKNKNVKSGLKKIVDSIPDHEVEETLSSIDELKTKTLSNNDIVLFELMDENLDVIKKMSRSIRYTSAKFVGMKSIENPDLEKRAFLSGLNGIIDKSSSAEKFKEMFNAVNSKGFYFSREILQSITEEYTEKSTQSSLKQKVYNAINFFK